MNQQALDNLKKTLQNRLILGCSKAVEVIKASTPIDTQRLYESTRVEADELNISSDLIEVNIVAGGIESYGVRREQNILKEVDYGIYVERRDGYIRQNMPEILDVILEEFEN